MFPLAYAGKRFHSGRASGRHRHHRDPGGPASARAWQSKAQARRIQCLNQLQQWGKALSMYAGDNADATPRRGQGVRPLTQLDRPEDWFNALAPELGVPGFWRLHRQCGHKHGSPPYCSSARMPNPRPIGISSLMR